MKGGLAICGLLALVIFVYAPTVKHDFIDFDDDVCVTENSMVLRGWTTEGWVWAWTTNHHANWHPLTWLSLMTDAQFYGDWAGGYHLTNVLLHMAATMVLFAALWQMTGQYWESLLIAGLYGLHPLHVQSVAWIAERKGLLSTLFWMLVIWSYGKCTRSQSHYWFLCSLGFFLAGLLSKQMLVTLPFVLLLLDYWPLNRMSSFVQVRKVVLEKSYFLFITACFIVVAYVAQSRGGALRESDAFPLGMRFAYIPINYVEYLRKMVWPNDLSCHYHHYQEFPSQIYLLSSMGLLIIVTWYCWCQRRSAPALLVGWLWYLGTLFPLIGLVQVGDHRLADRYMDIPSVGIYLAVVLGTVQLFSWPTIRRIVIASSIGLLLVLTALSRTEIGYWKNSHSLFQRALALDPTNPVMLNNLGTVLLDEGKVEKAKKLFMTAIETKPDYATALSNFGFALAEQTQFGEAIPYYEKAIELSPKFVDARNNLAVAYTRTGQFSSAERLLRSLVAERPNNYEYRNNLATTLARQHRYPEAIREYEAALRIQPNAVTVHFHLGRTATKLADWKRAVKYFESTLRLNPRVGDAYRELARAYVHLGRHQDAKNTLAQVFRMAPNDPETHAVLAWSICLSPGLTKEQAAEALQLADQVVTMVGEEHLYALEALAMALAATGQADRAEIVSRKAISMAEDQGEPIIARDLKRLRSVLRP